MLESLTCLLQKWSAKKVKDKANNMVVLDKPTYERLFKEVPTYKLITQSVLVDRLRLNGSLARVAIKELESQGLIKPLIRHHSQIIYSKLQDTSIIPESFGLLTFLLFSFAARATGDDKKAANDEE